MEQSKPGWLALLESGRGLTTCDLSHVRTGAGSSGVIPLLAWDHMQGLATVLEANLSTLQVLNLNGLRMGDVGLSALVERVLSKDTCLIQSIDMRHNAITAYGLRQAINKLSIFNYSITTWLLEENGSFSGSDSSNSSSSSSSSSSSTTTTDASSKRIASRPGPSATLSAKREKEKEKDKDSHSSHSSSSNGEPREILNMTFQEIVDKYVAEFVRLNSETMACVKGQASHLHLKYTLKHPRLCPTRMAKLVLSLQHATSLTIEGWTPPPPLTLKSQEKKLSKLTAEQIALKEIKRTVPGTLFASLPKLTELKLVKCVRVDIEKSKKGTLRGILMMGSGKSSKSSSSSSSSSFSKTTFVPSIPVEVGSMPCLRRLTLSECGLDEISPTALPFMTHIEQIDFSSNYISLLPPQISSLTNVTRLLLHSNSISDIPNELSSMRYLRELWIYDNLITKVPSDIAKWFPVLKDLRILTQRVEEGLVMEDPELIEYRNQEEDLIKTKSNIGSIGFLGMLKLCQAPELVLYKTPSGKKKK
jgi:hypothetical protein